MLADSQKLYVRWMVFRTEAAREVRERWNQGGIHGKGVFAALSERLLQRQQEMRFRWVGRMDHIDCNTEVFWRKFIPEVQNSYGYGAMSKVNWWGDRKAEKLYCIIVYFIALKMLGRRGSGLSEVVGITNKNMNVWRIGVAVLVRSGIISQLSDLRARLVWWCLGF